MKNIEVTSRTFFLIFTPSNKMFLKTEHLEHAKKHYYYNAELEQHGIIIHNFLSNVDQFYLTDINA